MKILFVCRANAERSQIAEILFNFSSKKHKATSAGIGVGRKQGEGLPAGRIVTELLLGMGHDEVTKKKRKQLTAQMAAKADRIIVMLGKKDIEEALPEHVKNSPKTVFWKLSRMKMSVYDSFPPHTYDYHAKWISEINDFVDKLVKEIG
jgi:protein-tyrosine-phosphatase